MKTEGKGKIPVTQVLCTTAGRPVTPPEKAEPARSRWPEAAAAVPDEGGRGRHARSQGN